MRDGRAEAGVAEELDALVRRLHDRHEQWQIEGHDGEDCGDRALLAEAERDLVRYVMWVNGVAPNVVGQAGAGTGLRGRPSIRSHRADYRRSAIHLHPCRGMSSDSVDRSSVDPRARDWIPTRRGVKMSGGASPHFNYKRDTL
jgi:hypothetical protein